MFLQGVSSAKDEGEGGGGGGDESTSVSRSALEELEEDRAGTYVGSRYVCRKPPVKE